MRWKRLFWKLYPSYFLVVLLSLFSVGLYSSYVLSRFHLDKTMSDLQAIALISEEHVRRLLQSGDAAGLDRFCKESGGRAGVRITVIESSGRVMGDSYEDPSLMERHDDRPEVRQALRGETGRSIRFSSTVKRKMMYVAVPVMEGGKVIAVVRSSLPVTSIARALRSSYLNIALGGLVVLGLAGLVSYVISRRISRPLEEMRRGAERFSSGEFTHRLPVSDSLELGALAESMNSMAEQLDERIRTVVKQRGELEAILASMIEGVIAVDRETRILSLNRTAAALLSTNQAAAQGSTLQEVVRNTELLRFVNEALGSREPMEIEIVLHHDGDRYIQAHGTPLSDARGQQMGALVVLNDVTRLRRLESFRRDFVANVSHELRTPITSIKGFVETLIDGALEDREKAQQFLEIINKHADRLSDLIEDLLMLSRLDQAQVDQRITRERRQLRALLEAAIELCRAKAANKRVDVDLSCDPALTAEINHSLLEQAAVNLIDNAIKYSPVGGKVAVTVAGSKDGLVISVRDHGCGIEHKHIPRIFERFYRVDKARSRADGGTGLGLAIVKHVAQAHGGSVGVESEPGRGSTFFIHLPRS